MKPIIGITAGEIHNQTEPWSPIVHGQSHTYSDSIINAGGTPLIVPLTNDENTLREIYSLLDGILFAGGNDLAPELYGQTAYPTTKDVSTFRDHVEQKLIRWALADKKPLLGICRGMQLLNVVQGGDLYQHIPIDLPATTIDHDSSSVLKDIEDVTHTLRVAPGSQLAAILHTATIGANAHHHQAIRSLGAQISAVAWAEDEVIEAIELNSSFAIGVQTHPESLAAQAEPKWQKLFQAFVEQAKLFSQRPQG